MLGRTRPVIGIMVYRIFALVDSDDSRGHCDGGRRSGSTASGTDYFRIYRLTYRELAAFS